MSLRVARGMTLTELVVSAGVLVAMMGGVGYVFTHTAAAVRATTGVIENNAAVRAVAGRLREDLAACDPDGMLILAAPAAGGGPDLLAFTVCGRVASCLVAEDGEPVTSNAALIVYAVARDASDPTGASKILCRYVYGLTGRDAYPANLAELIEQAATGDPNGLDDLDVLGESTAAIAAKDACFDLGSGAASIEADYIVPLLTASTAVNPAPQRLNDAAAGGVRQLWPYLCGSLDTMTVAFYDGLAADGTPPAGPSDPTAWISPADDDLDANVPRPPDDDACDDPWPRRICNGRYWVCSSRRTRTFQPRALKITLRFRHNDIRSGPVEIIVPLRH